MDVELKPISAPSRGDSRSLMHNQQNAAVRRLAARASSSNVAGNSSRQWSRGTSVQDFFRRFTYGTSGSTLNGVVVDEPEESKPRGVMFAPVPTEHKLEAPSITPDDGSDVIEVQKSKNQLIFEEDDLELEMDERIEKQVATNALKRFMHKIPLMHKAMVLVLLPVLALFILSIIDLSAKLDEKAEAQQVQEFTRLFENVTNLVVQITGETYWGNAAVSRDSFFVRWVLGAQSRTTDRIYEEVMEYSETYNLNEIYHQDAWKMGVVNLAIHPKFTQDILNKKVDAEEVANYYQDAIGYFITAMSSGSALTSDPDLRNAINTASTHFYVFYGWMVDAIFAIQAKLETGFPSEFMWRTYLKGLTLHEKYEVQMRQTPYYSVIKDHFELNTTQASFDLFRNEVDTLIQNGPVSGDPFVLIGGYWDLISNFQGEINELVQFTSDLAATKVQEASDDVMIISLSLTALAILSVILVALFVSSVNSMNRILENEVESRRKTEAAVWRFFPQEFIDNLNASDVLNVRPGDKNKVPMTVMFAQLLNFKEVSADSTAELMYDWLSDLVKEIIPIITDHGGFVDKTTGDGVMALFTDPEQAVNAALEIQCRISSVNSYSALDDSVPYNLGIGLHYGDVILGLIGTRKRLEATTISDTVNTASRVQGMCKFYGSKIIVTQAVADRIDLDEVCGRLIGEVKMKGKIEAIPLYDLYLTDDPVTKEYKRSVQPTLDEALELYQDGKFTESVTVIDRELHNKRVYTEDAALYRRKAFANSMAEKKELPSGWNGEDIFDQK